MNNMTEDLDDMYRKFKKFLDGYLIRRIKGDFNADDFDEEKSEYIRTHLHKLLPSLSLTEAMRIGIYFNDVFVFHLSDAIGIPSLPTQSALSPTPISDENDVGCSSPKRMKTQSQIADFSGLSSQTNITERTPLENLDIAQRRTTAPIMQSTPLSIPIVMGGHTGILSDQQRLEREQEDDFIADIISQLNLSPIARSPPPLSKVNENTDARPGISPVLNVPVTEVPFLRGFADLMKKSRQPKETQLHAVQRTTRDRLPIVETILRGHKKKKKKVDLEVLCSLSQKQRTEEENRRAQDSFLYFSLMPGKTKYLIERIIKNVVIPEGKRGYIPIDRIINLSNVMRAHASQLRQSSVEAPLQVSLKTILRSPCTPQTSLLTSQLQPFTTRSGDVSSQSPAMEMDHISSFPLRSMPRQQPLFTIPERDSTIPIPLSPQLEENPFTNSLISIPHLPENVSTITSGEDGALLPSLPRAIPEDIENIAEQPVISYGVISTDEAQRLDEFDPHIEVIPQNNDFSQVDANEDNARFNWFEVLRPREDVVYPQVNTERRKKKKRKRKKEIEKEDERPSRIYELPEIPMSTGSDFPNFPVLPDDFSEQTTQIPIANYLEEMESVSNDYFNLIKEGVKNPKYRTWEHFDPYLFSENDNYETYTYIFKRMIKDDFIAMDTLFGKGTTRLEAAKGFKLILELKTLGLIEIEAVDARIISFKCKVND